MSEQEPAHLRLERIRRALSNDHIVTIDDALFLLERLANAERMLRAQQDSVTDASQRWRAIGFEDGFQQGYACGVGEQ